MMECCGEWEGGGDGALMSRMSARWDCGGDTGRVRGKILGMLTPGNIRGGGGKGVGHRQGSEWSTAVVRD